MIVKLFPLSWIVFPIASGLPSNRRFQSLELITATARFSGRSCSSPEKRPTTGLTPMARKKIRAYVTSVHPSSAPRARQVDAAFVKPISGDLLEVFQPIPPLPGILLRVGIRHINARPEHDQLRRIAIGQRTDQHAVDDSKDRSVRAYSQR